MSRGMQIGIILAGGASSRMGVPKALLRDEAGCSFLERVAGAMRQGGCDAVLVVGGLHCEQIAAMLPEDLLLVRNADWERGQLSSAQVGLKAALMLRPARVLVHPVDQPMLTPRDVRDVLGAVRGRRLAVAEHQGKRGHPVGLSAAIAEAVAGDLSSATLRDALALHARGEVRVPASPGCVRGANTPAELEALLGSRRSAGGG